MNNPGKRLYKKSDMTRIFRMTLPPAIVALALSLRGPITAAAQDSRGKILGRVVDSTGAVLPGVPVKAVNAGTNVEFTGRTNEIGNYEIPL